MSRARSIPRTTAFATSPVPNFELPWSRISGANATRSTPSLVASRRATRPTRSIRSSDSDSSSPRPIRRRAFGLMVPSGGIRSRVSRCVPGEFSPVPKRGDDAAELLVQLDRRAEGRVARLLVLEVADDLQRDVGVVWPSHPYRQLHAARTGQRRFLDGMRVVRPDKAAEGRDERGPEQCLRPNHHDLFPRRARDIDPQNAQHPQPSPHDDLPSAWHPPSR